MKYRCKICNYIYDEEKEGKKFNELSSFACPMCFVDKVMFERLDDDVLYPESKKIFKNAVVFSDENKGVEKDDAKCIDCGICKETCDRITGLDFGLRVEECLACGQCVITCPTFSLMPKKDKNKVLKALKEGKKLICYTSPAIRVSIGEAFGYEPGTFLKGKLVGVLRMLGFTYVFDTTFGADLTIMEESAELKNRLENNGVLPMITSCCPAWVKYAEMKYPEILDHLSTCKSPIGMQGAMVKSYYLEKTGLKEDEVFTVAITPCTAKKFELARVELEGTDAVITIRELIEWIKEEKIDFEQIEESNFDDLLGEGSGGGTIFGSTGGVMESAIRNLYHMYTNESLEKANIDLSNIRSYDNVKEATVTIQGKDIRVAVIHKLSAAKPILEEIKAGTSPYHFIEIMNCEGGCVGGGGQPVHQTEEETNVKEKRRKGLYHRDEEVRTKAPYENPEIQKIYQEFLVAPNSEIAHKYLHTSYINRRDT